MDGLAAAAAAFEAAEALAKDGENEARPTKLLRSQCVTIPLALRSQFLDPAPTELPREAVETFLHQVDVQLDLARSLADNVCLEDAFKLQKLIHGRIKELAHLGDACIATWTDYANTNGGGGDLELSHAAEPPAAAGEDNNDEVAKRKVWMADSELSAPVEEDTLKETQLSRWTQEEVDLFNIALAGVDLTKRGYPEEIRKIVKTRTVVQIRERLRRIRQGGGKKGQVGDAAAAAAAAAASSTPAATTTTTTTTPRVAAAGSKKSKQ